MNPLKMFFVLLLSIFVTIGCGTESDKSPEPGSESPSAVFSVDQSMGKAPLTVTFDASHSRASDGNSIRSYDWDFGDGGTGTGLNPTHEYTEPGTWSVSLTVTDTAGKTCLNRQVDLIKVETGAPGTAPSAKYSVLAAQGNAPLQVDFDGTLSEDEEGDIREYTWDFGDGSSPGTGAEVAHLYTAPGRYDVCLTVSDSAGNRDTLVRKSIVVVAAQGVDKASVCARAMADCGIVSDGQGGYVSCGEPGEGEVCVSNRKEPAPVSADIENGGFDAPGENIFLHVPFQNVFTDISSYGHEVTMNETDTGEWVSRVDMSEKSVAINLNGLLSNEWTVSFKMMPSDVDQTATLLEGQTFSIQQEDGAVVAAVADAQGNGTELVNDLSSLNSFTCNHFALVAGQGRLQSFVNGQMTEVSAGTPGDIQKAIRIDHYPGKIWDLRIYSRRLNQNEILNLAGLCADERQAAERYADYPEYKAGVYVREWWPENFENVGSESGTNKYECSDDQLNHYIRYQDMVYERNILETGMYTQSRLFEYLKTGSGKDLMLSNGIRRGFVRTFSSEKPMTYQNSQYWLHENFHSFQGNLKRFQGFSAGKFFLECTASWGADSIMDGTVDSLQGLYTFDTHLPLWINQSHIIESSIYEPGGTPATTNGGHQYGAYILYSYITKNIVSDKLIGDIFNDNRTGEPARVTYELLEAAGFAMEDVFIDFASRVVTWDMPYGDRYLESEAASMRRYSTKILTTDHKFTDIYGGDGTGNQWTDIRDRYQPGSWGFNAYKVNADRDGRYTVGLKTSATNPSYADFRAKAVVYTASTGKRHYYTLDPGAPGAASDISVDVSNGDLLLFVVATTPDIFTGIETYDYQYRIYPE